jgi:hypothetical protein
MHHLVRIRFFVFEEFFSHPGLVVHDFEVLLDLVKIMGVDIIGHLMKLFASESPDVFLLRDYRRWILPINN